MTASRASFICCSPRWPGNRTLQKFLRELITRESLVILAYEKPGKPSCSNHEHQFILDALARAMPRRPPS